MDKIFLNIAFSLLSGVFTIFFLSFAGFIFGLHIMPVYTILGLVAAFVVFSFRLYFEKTPPAKILKYCILYALGLFCLAYITSLLKDGSYDGRMYHQTTIILLEKGWNPIYQDITEFINKTFQLKLAETIWSENYVKFSEIIAANIFSVTHKIETGKIINIISAIIAFCYAFYILSKEPFCKMVDKLRILFSFILVYNPVVIAQTFTYYSDGLVYLYFLIATLSVIDIKTSKNQTPVMSAFIFIISSVIMMNIKFGGILCFICILLGVLIFQATCKFKALKNPPSNLQNNNTQTDNSKKHSQRFFLHSVLIIILLTLLSGINPYFTNVLKERHPLYPLAGEGKIDITTPNTPQTLRNKPILYKFFFSVFSQSDYMIFYENRMPKLKMPFTIHKNELLSLGYTDTRIGGFGVFFSGILLFAVILLFLNYKSRTSSHTKEETSGEYTLLFLILGLSVLLNPENWWARYVPQLWAILAFIGIFAYTNIQKNGIVLLFACLMLINSFMVNARSIALSLEYTFNTIIDIQKIKSQKQKLIIRPPKYGITEFSALQKLKEAGVEYEIQR